MKANLDEVEDLEDIQAIPGGTYRCKVVECRESESPAGHTRWGIRWEVVDGSEFHGRTACWDSLHWSERGLPRVKFILEVIGLAFQGEIELEVDVILGREAMVDIQPEEREDSVTGIRRVQNRVPFAGYSPADEIEACPSPVLTIRMKNENPEEEVEAVLCALNQYCSTYSVPFRVGKKPIT